MKKNNFYIKAHLVVAAIRLHEHTHAGPPAIEDICRTLSISLEEGNRLCLKLSDLNIIDILEKTGEARIFVKDHLKIEEIPFQEAKPNISAELEKFKKSKEAHIKKIKSIQSGQAEKKRKLHEELEQKLKNSLKKQHN